MELSRRHRWRQDKLVHEPSRAMEDAARRMHRLDAYMTTPQADILEHERTHLPRLPHAKSSSYKKLMAKAIVGEAQEMNQCSQQLIVASWCISYCSGTQTRYGPRIIYTPSPIRVVEGYYWQEVVNAQLPHQQVLYPS
jgi:hypothetical protein